MEDIQISKALAASMQLRLPGTVGKIASKMRYIDEIAPKLRQGGLVHPIPELTFERLYTVGISTHSQSLPAFGGVLYGALALRHDVVIDEKRVVNTHQDSRVDVSDMNFLDTAQRLTWHEYRLTYDLLTDLFENGPVPDIILLDLPLLIMRSIQTNSLENEEVADEWSAVLDRISHFWGRWLSHCFPSNPKGPIIASLGRRYFGAILNAVQAQGHQGSLETLTEEMVDLVRGEWSALRQAGILRVLENLLHTGKRTAAYPYTALGNEVQRAVPRSLGMHGLLGYHLKIGYRTPVWQVESIGPVSAWDSISLDRLSGMIAYLTLYDHPKMLPLPLYYAKKLAYMPPELLRTYRNETRNLLRQGSVDQSWLEGLESLDDDKPGLPDFDEEQQGE
ncbi:MAG: hypothetical protein PHQ40_00795 [Anaerolineaceae bacterium]|nr:hypothetical protein [Anaerolineaceae bacterium]